jgi:hypothetical protein
MLKKMALCAVLILILVPAFAMAAGLQGQGSDTAQGNGLQIQQQIANKVQKSNQLQNNGEDQMFQNRTCNQECDMSMVMAKNQSQVRGVYAKGQGSVSSSSDQQLDQSRDRPGNQNWTRMKDQIHLQDGSCGNCSG